MFNLNDEISKWRSSLAESQTLETSDIDELESHLREEIEQLVTAKLSQQEAFWVARHRLGDADSLAEEFAKINASVLWRKRLFWAGTGLLCYEMAKHVGLAASHVTVLLGSLVGIRGYGLNVVEVLTQGTFFGAVILGLYRICRTKDMQGEWFSRVAGSVWGKLALFGGVLGIVAMTLAARIFAQAAVARLLGVRELGQLALLGAYEQLVWIVIVPLILLTVVMYLRPSRLRRAAA
jgi:hypothetical protein